MADKKYEGDKSVEDAERRLESEAGTVTEDARRVELEAAKIEFDEPALDTKSAETKAKEKVGVEDPFLTTKVGAARKAEEIEKKSKAPEKKSK